MIPLVWLIPIQTSRQMENVAAVLARHHLACELVRPGVVRERLDRERPPAAIVHGGPISPLLLDVQRWLAEFDVPTMVLLEDLTDHYETILLDRGVHDVVRLPISTHGLGNRLEAMASVFGIGPEAQAVAPLSSAGSLTVAPGTARTDAAGHVSLRLTRSELDLLHALARHPDRVVSRSELARALGRPDLSVGALESRVSRLRTKLREAGVDLFVDAVRGVGYRLRR